MYYICALMFATMGASAGSELLLTRIYDKLAKREGDPPASALLMGWDNIPVRSEKSLYDLAVWAAQDEGLKTCLLSTPAETLAAQLDSPDAVPVPLFAEFAARFQAHLEQFGHIIFQLDFASRPAAGPPRADAGNHQDVPARRGSQPARAPASQPAEAHPDRRGRPRPPEGLAALGVQQGAQSWGKLWQRCARMPWPRSAWATRAAPHAARAGQALCRSRGHRAGGRHLLAGERRDRRPAVAGWRQGAQYLPGAGRRAQGILAAAQAADASHDDPDAQAGDGHQGRYLHRPVARGPGGGRAQGCADQRRARSPPRPACCTARRTSTRCGPAMCWWPAPPRPPGRRCSPWPPPWSPISAGRSATAASSPASTASRR